MEKENWLLSYTDIEELRLGPYPRENVLELVALSYAHGWSNNHCVELAAQRLDGSWVVFYPTSLKSLVDAVVESQLGAEPPVGVYCNSNPISASFLDRRVKDNWHRPSTRCGDRDVCARSGLYWDIDAIRPKGSSATDLEKAAAQEVAQTLLDKLICYVEENAICAGDSGNGYFLLVTLTPEPVSNETEAKFKRLYKGLSRLLSTEHAKIDCSVTNVGRLMPVPGTLKRKGEWSVERPHRPVMFACPENLTRVSLGGLL